MNIIYVLTIILMLILHVLLDKKEEKENILKWLAISIIILLSYNICICVIMSYLKIKSTLISLSIMNSIVDILLGIKIYKDKKVQKYYISKIDILAIIVITAIVIAVTIKQYGIPMNIKNAITDASVHYFASDEFYNYSMLLFEKNSDVFNLWELYFLMPGSYINTGIIFKIFDGIITETYFCKIYFIFEILIWYLSGILMYSLLTQNKKEEKQKILPLIFSLVYMLGYPLNSTLSGFSYLSLALNVIITTLIIMQEKMNKNYKMLLLFLLNFGIMFTYYFFAPIVYLAIFWQIIKDIKNCKEKIFSIKNILNILYVLVIPGIFGILYFIVFQYIRFGSNPFNRYSSVLSMSGDIYKNTISNVLIFIILAVYYIIYCLKNKKDNIINKMLILNLVLSIILFIGMKLNVVSEYYNYKVYYLLWIFVISVACNGIEIVIQKNKRTKVITYICTTAYCIGLIASILTKQKLLIFDIFRENSLEIQNENKLILNKELDVLNYYNINIDNEENLDDTTMFAVSLREQGRHQWIYAINRNPYNLIDLQFGEPTKDLQAFMESNKKHFVLLKEDYLGDFEEIDNEVEKNNLKVLFRNEAGIILEKNKHE